MTVRDLKNLLERYDNDLDVEFKLMFRMPGEPARFARESLYFNRAGTMPRTERGSVVQVVEITLVNR